MSRRTLALTALVASALPLLAALLIFGCCVLPFHKVVHAVVPLCHGAAELVAGTASGEPVDGAPASTPEAKRPLEMFKAIVRGHSTAGAMAVLADLVAQSTALHRLAPRNAMSLGALRVDDDVGAQSLLSSFVI